MYPTSLFLMRTQPVQKCLHGPVPVTAPPSLQRHHDPDVDSNFFPAFC